MTTAPAEGNRQPSRKDDYFAAVVGSAAQSLLARLGTCESLLTRAETERNAPPVGGVDDHAAKRLSQERRKELDGEIDRFFQITQATLERLLIEERLTIPDTPPNLEHHPLAPEQLAALPRMVAERDLRERMSELVKRVEDDPLAELYVSTRLVARAQEPAIEVLGAALLPMVVSSFEQYLGGLIRAGLTRHPLALGEIPDAPFHLVQRLAGRNDVERYLIDQKVAAFLRDSPLVWQQRIKKWTKIDVADLGAGWDEVREAIQRRHALTHNGGMVDEGYLAQVPSWVKSGLSVGDRLACTPGYMRQVIQCFRLLGIILALRWATHFANPAPLSVFPGLVQEIYELELRGLWRPAYQLADAAIGASKSGEELDGLLLVNWWLCKQRLGLHDVQMQSDITAWTPTEADLVAARAALLGNHAELSELLRTMTKGRNPNIVQQRLRGMPIFERALEQSAEVRLALSGQRSAPSSRKRRGRRR